MDHRLTATFAAFALVTATDVAGAEPPQLQPATAWNLRYDEQACRLVRQFGTGDDAVTFTLARYTLGPGFELLLSGKRMNARGASLRYRFVPADEFDAYEHPLYGTSPQGVTTWQLSGRLIGRRQADAIAKLPEELRDRAAEAAEKSRIETIRAFEVKSGMQRSFVLATGPLGPAFAALDTCLDDLVSTWGFDPAAQRKLARKPEPASNPGHWISYEDYPREQLTKAISGIVRFRLDVGLDGLPTKCVVQASYSAPEFERATCAILMKKARFEPAKDANGASVASYWVSSVKWLAN